jgi:hypothetical protein
MARKFGNGCRSARAGRAAMSCGELLYHGSGWHYDTAHKIWKLNTPRVHVRAYL